MLKRLKFSLPCLGKRERARSLPKKFSTLIDFRCPYSYGNKPKCKWGSFCHLRHGPKKYIEKPKPLRFPPPN